MIFYVFRSGYAKLEKFINKNMRIGMTKGYTIKQFERFSGMPIAQAKKYRRKLLLQKKIGFKVSQGRVYTQRYSSYMEFVNFIDKHFVKLTKQGYSIKQIQKYANIKNKYYLDKYRRQFLQDYGYHIRKTRGQDRYKLIETPMVCLIKMYYMKWNKQMVSVQGRTYSAFTTEWEFKVGLKRSEITRDLLRDMLDAYISTVPEFVDDFNHGYSFQVGAYVSNQPCEKGAMSPDAILRLYDSDDTRMRVYVKPNNIFNYSANTKLDDSEIKPMWDLSVDIDNFKKSPPADEMFRVSKYINIYERGFYNSRHYMMIIDDKAIQRFASANLAKLRNNQNFKIRSRKRFNDDRYRVYLDSIRMTHPTYFDYASGLLFDYKLGYNGYVEKKMAWTKV